MKKILALLTSLSVNNIFVTSIVSCTFCSNNSEEANLLNENIDAKPNEDSQNVKVSIDDETKDNEAKPYYEYTMLATGTGLFKFIKKVIQQLFMILGLVGHHVYEILNYIMAIFDQLRF